MKIEKTLSVKAKICNSLQLYVLVVGRYMCTCMYNLQRTEVLLFLPSHKLFFAFPSLSLQSFCTSSATSDIENCQNWHQLHSVFQSFHAPLWKILGSQKQWLKFGVLIECTMEYKQYHAVFCIVSIQILSSGKQNLDLSISVYK